MDDAREKADKELEKLEKKIKKEYTTAKKEITKEWREYMGKAEKQISEAQMAYDKLLADPLSEFGDIRKARRELSKVKESVTLRDERYRAVVDGFTDRLAHTNEIAIAYANDVIPALYAIGYNQAGADMSAIGMDFTLYDEHTVKNLFRQDNAIFPKKKVNVPKDKRWNTKKVNSAVLQGILQGESMDDIAKRIYPIVDSNASAAIRSARTLVTGAENKGRLDSYKEMEKNGVVLNKVWLATPDGRTREWHIEMDGQSVGVNEMFVDGLGNELEYPADPNGAPESVYNCRCTMYTDIVGFTSPTTGELFEVDYTGIDKEDPLHKLQMEIERDRRKQAALKAGRINKDPELKHDEHYYKLRRDEYLEFAKLAVDSKTAGLYNMFDARDITQTKDGGFYRPATNSINYSLEHREGRSQYTVLAHEYNHLIDNNMGRLAGLNFSEADAVNACLRSGAGMKWYTPVRVRPSASDEFLAAFRKDAETLTKMREDGSLRRELLKTKISQNASAGVQDAADGLFGTQSKGELRWGHGEHYYNRFFNNHVKGSEQKLKQVYKDLGMDASNVAKVKNIARNYDTTSEIWANVGSAVTCGGPELEYTEKYLPNCLAEYRRITGVKE